MAGHRFYLYPYETCLSRHTDNGIYSFGKRISILYGHINGRLANTFF